MRAFGVPSRTMMYLAAAGALYAWRNYAQGRPATALAGARARRPASDDAQSERESQDDRGAGITDLPPTAERAEQDSLPPRGQRKSDYHA
jgi:hypothetical protein